MKIMYIQVLLLVRIAVGIGFRLYGGKIISYLRFSLEIS